VDKQVNQTERAFEALRRHRVIGLAMGLDPEGAAKIHLDLDDRSTVYLEPVARSSDGHMLVRGELRERTPESTGPRPADVNWPVPQLHSEQKAKPAVPVDVAQLCSHADAAALAEGTPVIVFDPTNEITVRAHFVEAYVDRVTHEEMFKVKTWESSGFDGHSSNPQEEVEWPSYMLGHKIALFTDWANNAPAYVPRLVRRKATLDSYVLESDDDPAFVHAVARAVAPPVPGQLPMGVHAQVFQDPDTEDGMTYIVELGRPVEGEELPVFLKVFVNENTHRVTVVVQGDFDVDASSVAEMSSGILKFERI
jgi:hypothetical protein